MNIDQNKIRDLLILILLSGGALAACSSGSPAGCETDSECPSGSFCRLQECVYDCITDRDCPGGFYCDSRGRCQEGCAKTNGGVETCDGIDNDCDDETDEGLLNRCGECDPPNDQLFELCGDGIDNNCDGRTDEGFADLDAPCTALGCLGTWICSGDFRSMFCSAPEPAEYDPTCDAYDDDCDGETDEDFEPVLCPLQNGVCVGAADACLEGGNLSGCDYGSAYTADVDNVCDQQDNDCDGMTDEDADFLLVPELGELAGDGLDNNCNGLIDEPGGVMVPAINYPSVWIDAYETTVFASADCQGQRYGEGVDDYPAGWPEEGNPSETLYSCSLPGIVPSGYLSWFRARWACEAQGKVLCPTNWWGDACTGGTFLWYPYGTDLTPGVCNDPIAGPGIPVMTGYHSDCTAGNGTFDMSGNLAEWLLDWSEEFPGNALTGGYHGVCEICYEGLNCHECDPDDPLDYESLEGSLNCFLGGREEEIFQPNQGRSYLGTRCCLELP